MANQNLTISGRALGESKAIKGGRCGLARALPLALGLGATSSVWAQTAVEYGTLGAQQAGTAVAAGTAAAPASGQMAAVAPGAAKKRAAAETAAGKIDGPNCVGEMGAPSVVSVAVGKSSLLRLPEPVVKRTVGNPELVETRLVSAQMLYVIGLETGSTNMILQGKSGRCVVVDVLVGFDGGGLEAKIRELFPDEGSVKVSSAADSLVLSGVVSDAARATQVVQLANAYVRTGQSAGKGGGQAGGAQAGVQAVSPRVVNMMAVAAPQQVMLEVKVAEVSKTLLEKLGAEAGGSRTNGDWTYSFLSNFLSGGGAKLGAFKNSANLLRVDAEDKEELFKILAEPMIMAISGQEGSFLAGGKIFIPVAQNNTSGGGTTITLEEKEFGVGLKFTPTVLAGGRINLRVAPEVSEVNPEGIGVSLNTEFLTGRSILPSITTRRAATTVQLMDGQSFAIGGLIKNNIKHSVKAYPFLGEVPVLGALFRSNEFTSDRSELLFVVTPRLVKPLPPDHRLPTDAYSEPSRGGRLLNGEMEGQREGQQSAAGGESESMPAKSASGFEVK